MSTLWSHIYSQLDHGSALSFTVTKTGIDGELMVVIHPGKQNESLDWFPPPIFRQQAKLMDQTFEEEFKKLPIGKMQDIFRNRDIWTSTVETMAIFMKQINESKNMPKRKQKVRSIKALADSLFRLGNYEEAMTEYVKMNAINPDEKAQLRIETCLGMIEKQRRDAKGEPEPEILTDPFPDDGFGEKQIKYEDSTQNT